MTTAQTWDRSAEGGADREPAGKLAGHRGPVSVIQLVEMQSEGRFYDEGGNELLITEQDEQTAQLVVALKVALGGPLKPTGYTDTKETPPYRIVTRNVAKLTGSLETFQLIGRDDDRRACRVVAGAGSWLLGPERMAVENGVGWLLSPLVMTPLNTTGELWVRPLVALAADSTIYFLGESGDTRNVPFLGSIANDAPAGTSHKHNGVKGTR